MFFLACRSCVFCCPPRPPRPPIFRKPSLHADFSTADSKVGGRQYPDGGRLLQGTKRTLTEQTATHIHSRTLPGVCFQASVASVASVDMGNHPFLLLLLTLLITLLTLIRLYSPPWNKTAICSDDRKGNRIDLPLPFLTLEDLQKIVRLVRADQKNHRYAPISFGKGGQCDRKKYRTEREPFRRYVRM